MTKTGMFGKIKNMMADKKGGKGGSSYLGKEILNQMKGKVAKKKDSK
jgi:hypothetical protein